MSDIIAKKMRNNLKRDYGVKVFHIGQPLLAIRIPKAQISDFNKDDTDNIVDLLSRLSDQLRLREVVRAYILADKSHVEVEPEDIFKEIFDKKVTSQADTAGKEPPIEEFAPPEKPVALTGNRTSIFRTPSYVAPVSKTPVFTAPVHQAPIDREPDAVITPEAAEPRVEEKKEEIKNSSNKGSEEKIVRNILSDFARRRKKKLVSTRIKSGRRAEVLTKGKRGRYVRYRMPDGKVEDIAVAPTIRAAAMHAKDGRIKVSKSDYREKVRRRRISTLINIVLDTSGSMDEIDKVDITRSVIVALLKDAYQRRDKVSLVSYSGRKGELVLPFTSSVELAKRYLETIPFGGTTPLASGILMGIHALHNEIKKDPSTIPIMVLVTDGKANMPLEVGGNIRRELSMVLRYVINEGIHLLVVDMSSTGSVLANEIAEETNGKYYHPEQLSMETLYKAISEERDDVSNFANVPV